MTLQDFKLKMISELSSIYEMDQLNSIFNLLSEDSLKIPRSKILLANEIDLNESNQTFFQSALERLKTHEPIQYVLGKTSFMDMEFKVNSSVLIPRPETEELCSWILSHQLNDIKILDIGTGSGLIALVLKKHIKNSTVDGWDNSIKALNLAKSNAKKNNINVNFKLNDIFKKDIPKNEYDLIVSNHPYVSYDDYNKIHERVKKYEPNNAIFVNDNDLLIFYKIIIKKASISLKKNGLIFFECNEKNIEDVFNVLNDHKFKNIDIKKDFRNKKRMIKAEK